MAKRKKFDGGGSVMDKPSKDMRDPAYRKQLERGQALETSAPELMLVGPGGAAKGLKDVVGAPAKFRGAAPEIGSQTPRALHKQNLKELKRFDDMSPAEKKALARSTTQRQIENIREPLQRDYAGRGEKLFDRAVSDLEKGVMRTIGTEGLTGREGMKKGGAVKSASYRADGIAQRGKTKGRIV